MTQRARRPQPRINAPKPLESPWYAPTTQQEDEGLAQSAVISGASGDGTQVASALPTDAQVTTMLSDFGSSLFITGLGLASYT
jgi:hypothetical protein